VSRIGQKRLTAAASSHSASTPFKRLALTRRIPSRKSLSVWARFNTPRWLSIRLKFSSADNPSHNFSECS